MELLQEQDPEKQKALYKDIKEYEHSGDMITAKLYEELNKTFVTPFDREDINLLSGRMDTFLDFIHDAAKRMLMYRPKSVNQLLIAMPSRRGLPAELKVPSSGGGNVSWKMLVS